MNIPPRISPVSRKQNIGRLAAALALSLGSGSALAQTQKTYISGANWSSAVWSPSGAPDANTDIETSNSTTANSTSFQSTSREVRDYTNSRTTNFQFLVGTDAVNVPTVTFTLRNVTTAGSAAALTFRNADNGVGAYGNLGVHIREDLDVNSVINVGQTTSASSSLATSLHSFVVDGETTINTGGFVNVTRLANVSAPSAGSFNLGTLNLNGGTLNLTIGTGANGSSSQENTVFVRSLNGTATGLVQAGKASSFGQLTILGEENGAFAGTIADGNGQTRLTKNGTGSQELTGSSSYTGATSITGGSLILSGSGSINGTSDILITAGSLVSTSSVGLSRNVTLNGGTVRYGSAADYTGNFTFTAGTLAGTNWEGGLGGQTIGLGKFISPGDSPGAASTTSQIWQAGGGYNWQIYDAAGEAGVGFDAINFSGTLDLTQLSEGERFNLNVWSLSAIGPDADGDALNFNASGNYSWLLGSADQILIDGGANVNDLITINLSAIPGVTGGFTNANDTGAWSVTLGGASNNQLFLNYQTIPEPSVASLLGGAMLLGFMAHRRSVRQS